MPRPDEVLIHAWLDGELDAAEAARVAALVASDKEWEAAAAEARGLIAASSRIVSALDVIPAGVIPSRSTAAGTRASRFSVRPWMRVAAGLVLVAGIGYVATTRDGPPMGFSAPASLPAPAVSEPVVAEAPKVAGAGADASTAAAKVAPDPARDRAGDQRRAESELAANDARADRQSQPTQTPPAPVVRPDARTLGSASAGTRARGEVAPPVAPPSAPPASRQVAVDSVRADESVLAKKAVAEARERDGAQLSPRTLADREGRAEFGLTAASPIITGCWRTRTAAVSDSVLRSPPVVARAGDTLVVLLVKRERDLSADAVRALPTANVVRESADLLRGTARGPSGQPVAFTATRISCP